MDSPFLLSFFDILGVFIFALSGALVGGKKRMDIMSMLVLAFAAAVSGGVLRELLVGETPIVYLVDATYLLFIVLATIIVFSFREHIYRFGMLIKVCDAIGLGIFFSSGMTIALQHHLGFVPSIVIGAIAGSFGGVIRDVLSAEVPLIFRKELYILICILGGAWYFLLYLFPIQREYIVISTALVVAVLRIVALHRNWSLPRVNNH